MASDGNSYVKDQVLQTLQVIYDSKSTNADRAAAQQVEQNFNAGAEQRCRYLIGSARS